MPSQHKTFCNAFMPFKPGKDNYMYGKHPTHRIGQKHSEITKEKCRISKLGELNPKWKRDNACAQSGRSRAERLYPQKPCEVCGVLITERHHKDNDTKNNNPRNIIFVCRRCHMEIDGRLKRMSEFPINGRTKNVVMR